MGIPRKLVLALESIYDWVMKPWIAASVFWASLSACVPILKEDRSPLPPLHRTGASYQCIGQPIPENENPPQGNLPVRVDISQPYLDFQNHRNAEGMEAELAWIPFIEILYAYLDQETKNLELSHLIRSRVALEFELDVERQRAQGCDPDLERIAHDLIARIDQKVRSLHATNKRRTGGEPAELGFLSWPISQGVLTSGFGFRRDPIRRDIRFHEGIDLAASPGDPVHASASGTVVRAGWAGDAGFMVRIRHDEQTETAYAHLSAVLVSKDQAVSAGDVIGLAGCTGRSTGTHLHFSLYVDGQALDPLDALQSVPLFFSDQFSGIVFGAGSGEH
jgi:murein DD-endopeptidase MepM/ murein hydrolase activator NlpD